MKFSLLLVILFAISLAAKHNFKKALEMVKASGDPEWEFYETDYNRVNPE